jgi:hypothetical protein
MPKPPAGQDAIKEMILRYVKIDASLRPIDIKRKLLKDHGIETTRNYIGRTRTVYLEGLDVDNLQIAGRRLKQAVRVLGRLMALRADIDELIEVLAKKPPPIEREKPPLSQGDRVYTCRRTKEQRDRYNRTRRLKARREKRNASKR